MPLIFSVLCEPSYFCVRPCTEREKKKKKTKQKSGNMGVRIYKEQENRKRYFTKGWKTGHREGMKHTNGKKQTRRDRMKQEQDSRVRITWVKEKNRKCSQFSEMIVCHAVLLPAQLCSCLEGSFFHWALLRGLIHTSSTFLACAGV